MSAGQIETSQTRSDDIAQVFESMHLGREVERAAFATTGEVARFPLAMIRSTLSNTSNPF